MANVQELKDSNLETTLQSAERPVLIDFSATWCQPCKTLAPKIDAVATDYEGKLDVYKVDIEQAQEAAARFGVGSVPTCIFFHNGTEVSRFVGDKNIREIKESCERVISG